VESLDHCLLGTVFRLSEKGVSQKFALRIGEDLRDVGGSLGGHPCSVHEDCEVVVSSVSWNTKIGRQSSLGVEGVNGLDIRNKDVGSR